MNIRFAWILGAVLILSACSGGTPTPRPSASNGSQPTPGPGQSADPSGEPSSTPIPTPLPMPTGSKGPPLPSATPVPSATPLPETVTNSLNMTFVRLSASSFQMGSPTTEANRGIDETQHSVTLSKPFLIQTTEVTQRQWKQVMGNNPAFYQKPENLERPVENISYQDALAFINKLNQQAEGTYRLPTEAEWEYAARAGSQAIYTFGSNPRFLNRYAWFAENAGEPPITHAVGQLQPNAWGLYDMQGNVAEFVADAYQAFGPESVTDPQGPLNAPERVYRGCHIGTVSTECRLADRNLARPDFAFKGLVGLRLIRN